jgi:drug/metabolite transporter (DMT)-like permease
LFESRLGELAALGTAFCWTITALSFEAAGRRVGSLAVNLLRLVIGFCGIAIWNAVARGQPLPAGFPLDAWLWLAASGVIGFALGDLFLFRAFVMIGSRISMLVMASVPPLTALIGWTVLAEGLTPLHLLGMGLTVGGICVVVLERPARSRNESPETPEARPRRPIAGILLAFGGALGQAVGLVLGKIGLADRDPFAATQIRILAGTFGFVVLFTALDRWQRVGAALRNGPAMRLITLGATFGPFLGVSLSLLAVQHTETGIASTIMSIVPVLIIPPAVLLFRERVTAREVLGAVVAVAGVAVMFR